MRDWEINDIEHLELSFGCVALFAGIG